MVGGNNQREEYMLMGVMIKNKDEIVIRACKIMSGTLIRIQ